MKLNSTEENTLARYCQLWAKQESQLTAEYGPSIHADTFRPMIMFQEELRLTTILFKDDLTIWAPLEIIGITGHCVDLGYASNGDLIGVQIWADVRRRPK